jgi:hypothetical protein
VPHEARDLFVRLAPALNVQGPAAERTVYLSLGLPGIYEGDEYPDYIAFGTDTVQFRIQPASGDTDPPGVLTWQTVISGVDAAAELCPKRGIAYEVEQNEPAPGLSYRRLILRTPSGYRLVLEDPTEARRTRPSKARGLLTAALLP